MFMRARILVFPCVLFLGLVSCGKPGAMKRVDNAAPKFRADQFAALDKLCNIDVTQISMFGKDSGGDFKRRMAFDSEGNLYILDEYDCKISVFDMGGKFLRAFGRKGQGPSEFVSPDQLVAKDDKLYIFQGLTGEFKVLDSSGKFLGEGRYSVENRLGVGAFERGFLVLRAKLDPTFTKLEFILARTDDNFESSRDIFHYDYPPGFNGLNGEPVWQDWLLVTGFGDFYFPEDNLRKYSIIKYDQEGRAELGFGRKSDSRPYSRKARDLFQSLHEREIKSKAIVWLPAPPVVRNIFQDAKKNIWVVAGETYEDNHDPDFENTVDIFSPKGEWLASMRSKIISRDCLYHDGRIYRVLPINLDTFDQFIEVYAIQYVGSN